MMRVYESTTFASGSGKFEPAIAARSGVFRWRPRCVVRAEVKRNVKVEDFLQCVYKRLHHFTANVSELLQQTVQKNIV